MNDYKSKPAFGTNVMPHNTEAKFQQQHNSPANLPQQGNNPKADEKKIAKAVKSSATPANGGNGFKGLIKQ